MATVVAMGIAYFVGSIPVAVLVARRRGFDPRDRGDGNPGYWNMREQMGARSAAPVFAGDVAKGVVAAIVGVTVAPDDAWGVGYAAVGAAMVGHAWPIFARWKGGRSVLTWVGGMCVLAPLAAVIAVALFLAITLAGRFAAGAGAGVAAFPVVQILVESPYRAAATGALMSFIGLRFFSARSGRSGPATSSEDEAQTR